MRVSPDPGVEAQVSRRANRHGRWRGVRMALTAEVCKLRLNLRPNLLIQLDVLV